MSDQPSREDVEEALRLADCHEGNCVLPRGESRKDCPDYYRQVLAFALRAAEKELSESKPCRHVHLTSNSEDPDYVDLKYRAEKAEQALAAMTDSRGGEK